MIEFSYSIDEELKVPMGQLPTTIQTQAFQTALLSLASRIENAKNMLIEPTQGLKATPYQGLATAWQKRISQEVLFLEKLKEQLIARSLVVALKDRGNAVVQGDLEKNWNRWAPVALQAYANVAPVFDKEIALALSNSLVPVGTPPAYIVAATYADISAPQLSNVTTSLGDMYDMSSLKRTVLWGTLGVVALGSLSWWLEHKQGLR